MVKSFASVPLLYIADGHHRAASASRARAELKEQGFGFIGNEEYNCFLSVVFPDDQLKILPYNRIVRDLNFKYMREGKGATVTARFGKDGIAIIDPNQKREPFRKIYERAL